MSDTEVQKTETGSENQDTIMDELNKFNSPPVETGSEEVESKEAETKETPQPEEQSDVEESPKEDSKPEEWLIENKFRNDEDGRKKLAESYKNMQRHFEIKSMKNPPELLSSRYTKSCLGLELSMYTVSAVCELDTSLAPTSVMDIKPP